MLTPSTARATSNSAPVTAVSRELPSTPSLIARPRDREPREDDTCVVTARRSQARRAGTTTPRGTRAHADAAGSRRAG